MIIQIYILELANDVKICIDSVINNKHENTFFYFRLHHLHEKREEKLEETTNVKQICQQAIERKPHSCESIWKVKRKKNNNEEQNIPIK